MKLKNTFIIKLNSNFENETSFSVINNSRVIYSPTGPLNRDYDDVRRVADATTEGVKMYKIKLKSEILSKNFVTYVIDFYKCSESGL